MGGSGAVWDNLCIDFSLPYKLLWDKGVCVTVWDTATKHQAKPVWRLSHIKDCIRAYRLTLERKFQRTQSDIINLDIGKGFSIQEITNAVKRVTRQKVPVVYGMNIPKSSLEGFFR